MSSEIDHGKQAELHRFTDAPLTNYFFAICITTLAKTSYLAFRTYECLSSGSESDCRWSGAATVGHDPTVPVFRSILFVSGSTVCSWPRAFLFSKHPYSRSLATWDDATKFGATSLASRFG